MDRISIGSKYLGWFQSPYISLVSRVILGGVFTYAGIAKIPHIQTLIGEITNYQILPYGLAVAYGMVLPYVEVFLGVLLLFGLGLRISATVTGLTVLSFSIAKASALLRGLDIDVCPCFGPSVPLLSTHSLAIDLVLLALALELALYRGKFLSIDALFSMRKRSKQER